MAISIKVTGLLKEMDFYPKDDLDVIKSPNVDSEIKKIYSGARIFITGSTGFVGKVLLEKLIRSCNVAQIFLLVRKKRGKNPNERLQELLNDVVFERMLIENKNARNLITLINGDFTLPDLGLSKNDLQIIHNVDFIFHSAATVNMGEHLKTAFYINVNGTRFLLEQAKQMKNLKAFVYISTAYAQVMLKKIEEKFYPTEYSPEDLEKIVISMDDAQLTAITPHLVGKWENTYSFTKAITEFMVSRYHPYVPVAVARPSIITSTVSEPIVGWIDNIYGATGVCAGAGAGLLKVWNCDPNAIADLIPVDVVINTVLSIGWYMSTFRPSVDKIVFNLVSSEKKPVTWKTYMNFCENVRISDKIFCLLPVGIYSLKLVKSKLIFWFYTMFMHVFIGSICDVGMKLAGFPPKFLSGYRKIYRMNENFGCYCLKEFRYSDGNVDGIWASMNSKDKEIFNFEQSSYTYDQYFRFVIRGLRFYMFKQPWDTLARDQKFHRALINFVLFMKIGTYMIYLWFAVVFFDFIIEKYQ
uniref:Fatty acyl-CoA reductase n=3 Tax=Clastoptera arizonana TaxID=38151 RepID=A0A1B6E5T0_9HEMI